MSLPGRGSPAAWLSWPPAMSPGRDGPGGAEVLGRRCRAPGQGQERVGDHTGVLCDAVLAGWCNDVLRAAPGRVLFRRQHLSQVVAFELTDGRSVVVKARPFEERIEGCVAIQAALARSGFPCPAPIAGPAEVDAHAVTAEMLIAGVVRLPPAAGAGPFAALLAQLVKTAPPVRSVAPVTPSPPWAGWDHPGRQPWPDRDDRGGDLNRVTGPAWVDRAARLVRRQMSAWHAAPCIGHGD